MKYYLITSLTLINPDYTINYLTSIPTPELMPISKASFREQSVSGIPYQLEWSPLHTVSFSNPHSYTPIYTITIYVITITNFLVISYNTDCIILHSYIMYVMYYFDLGQSCPLGTIS